MTLKILLHIPLSNYSGYGQDGIGIVQALARQGHDIYIQPMHVDVPLPAEVTALLTKRLEAPFDLQIMHADPGMLNTIPLIRDVCDLNVAWTMWEYTTLDNSASARLKLRKRLSNFDVVIGYDSVSSGALAKYCDGPLATLQGGYTPDGWSYVERDWSPESRFGFCMVGALDGRKDPMVALQAFSELKNEYPDEFEPAELHLKTMLKGLPKGLEQLCPKLRIHYGSWSLDLMRSFYAAQHCLLAPSRGEGKNLPALEFLSTGGAVIATNWGGHTQWMNPKYAYPLDYVLRPVNKKFTNCYSARANKDHLKELMLDVFRNRDKAKEKGIVASQAIPQLCSWDTVMNRFFDLVAEVEPTLGDLS